MFVQINFRRFLLLENTDREITRIITEDCLFYSNYDKQLFTTIDDPDGIYDSDKTLWFSLVLEKFPVSIVYLRKTYRLKVGKPQPWSNGVVSDNQIGLYIVDYERYLNDIREGTLPVIGKGYSKKIVQNQIKLKNLNLA